MRNRNGIQGHAQAASAGSPWLRRLLCTPLRCHVVGSVLALTLVALTSWIWIHPETLSADHRHTPKQIEDAISLISSSDRLQNRFKDAADQRNLHEDRIEEIATWLPAERSWDNVRSTLQSLSASSNVQMIALDRGNIHLGARIAVLDTRCEVQGSFPNVCDFLQRIVDQDLPIWCDEIRMVRGESTNRYEDRRGGGGHSIPCLATLSLRVPFAGEDTTAAKLLQRRTER